MLSSARKKTAPARALTKNAPKDPPRPDAATPDAEPALRLELAGGHIGLELVRPVRVGEGLEFTDLAFALRDLRFPLDLSGGVRKFRHVRGVVRRARLELSLCEASKRLGTKLPRALVKTPAEVTLIATLEGLLAGVRWSGGALAFAIAMAPLGEKLRLVVEDARALGLEEAAHTVALRLVHAMLPSHTLRSGSLFIVEDPLHEAMVDVLPAAGARVPSTEGVKLAFITNEPSGKVGLALADPPPPLAARTIRALETAELLQDADDLAFHGERERARGAYLAALENAPRHREATHRLAAIDLVEHRYEAAMSSIVELESVVSAGILGAEVLRLAGDPEAAYSGFARAGAEEPTPGLSAYAWFEAAKLAIDRKSRDAALDEAVVRWPRFHEARWMRLRERLRSGDARGAFADYEHLDANAEGREARCVLARDAGGAFLERGFVEDAEKLFERAVRYEPRDPRAIAGLARALRDRGKTARGLDLLSRAVSVANELGHDLSDVELELAESLVAYAGDRPNAIARASGITAERACAPRARLAEATWRFELGDRAGATRALGRLRSIAETRAPEPTGSRRVVSEATAEFVETLLLAGRFESDVLMDIRGARRTFALVLRFAPADREAARRLSGMTPDDAEPAEEDGSALPSSHVGTPDVAPARKGTTDRPVTVVEPAFDEGQAEERVEQLSQRLRADPRDHVTADELARLLERLGRDLELLALLSARVEDAVGVEVVPLVAARRSVLLRLAETAAREGRADESELYASMAES